MTCARDYQQDKVYWWEDHEIGPRTNLIIPFHRAQMFVDGVWLSLGLMGAPIVEPISKRFKRVRARGCRPYIEIPDECPAWIILHELAHSLTMDYDACRDCDGHGPKFMGKYLTLLDKVLGIPLALTMYSAKVHGLDYVQPY